MFNLEIKNDVLTKVSFSGDDVNGWLNLVVFVPDNVTEISSNIFDESCFEQILGICLHNGVQKIADDAFNVDKLSIIIENKQNNDHPISKFYVKNILDNSKKDFLVQVFPKLFRIFRIYNNPKNPYILTHLLSMRFTVNDGSVGLSENFFELLTYKGCSTIATIVHKDDYEIESFNLYNEKVDEPHNYNWEQGQEFDIDEIVKLLERDKKRKVNKNEKAIY